MIHMAVPVSEQVLPWIVCALICLCATFALFIGLTTRRHRRLVTRTLDFERTHERLRDEIWELREMAEARARAEAASEAKSRFLATVSHEIRTPLSGIVGMADLLSGTPLSREQQAYVTVIKTSGSALTTLIDEILDLSRIESGRLDLSLEPFDLTALVEGVVELIAPRAQEKGLEIASTVGRDLPAWVVGDALRLRQVLTNLADNAVKFTASGSVGLRVSTGPDGTIAFSVTDTGPGVPLARRSAIFEEFEQADGSTTREHGGSGLGLAIAKRIIDRMGGDLDLLDRDGGGSVFSFAVALPASAGEIVPKVRPRPHAGRRALVVSPGLFEPLYLQEQLESEGIDVLRAESVAEATKILRQQDQPLDLMFVDCALGEQEARSLAVAAQSFAIRRTVLLFSPVERHGFGQQIAVGFDGWLVKPIRAHSLAERLQEPRRGMPPGQSATKSVSGRQAKDGLRVLVAEDNPINALIARTALERCGALVTQASDGLAALHHVETGLSRNRSPFDLILMDVSMPGLDGLDVTRRIRSAEQSLGVRPVRIIAMTAHAFEATRVACRQAGMDDVLTKPINPSAFRALVEQRESDRIAV